LTLLFGEIVTTRVWPKQEKFLHFCTFFVTRLKIIYKIQKNRDKFLFSNRRANWNRSYTLN
jgi:hypothetical protein